MNEDSKECFHCGEVKLLNKFKVNDKRYKLSSDKGRCIGCIDCTGNSEKVKDRILSKYHKRNREWWI